MKGLSPNQSAATKRETEQQFRGTTETWLVDALDP